MVLETLKLIQWRNYAALELHPSARLTMLTGANAQGKTNIVEAIFLLAAGRSHRTPRESELVLWGADGAYARADFLRGNIERRVELRLQKNGRKQGRVDGASVRRMGDLIGCLNAVLFSPEDLRLVKNGPGERRRFMDMELSQIRPKYFLALSRYSRALLQRNALLKEMGQGKGGALDEFDALLAESGREVIELRAEFMCGVGEIAANLHARISGGERLSVRYRPDVEAGRLADLLAANRADDLRRGATQRGPHKDDIALYIGGNDARAYASQGQQRTLALSLKLSEIELMHTATGEYPVLLLDDVMSELDESRQRALLESMENCQTILTATQADARLAKDADVYRVREGELEML